MKTMRVGFFAKVEDRSALDRVEFYKQDLDILRESGFEVQVATNWKQIPLDVDFYFVWWWQWGFLPMLKCARRPRPCLITGVFDLNWSSTSDYYHRPFMQRWLMRYALKGAQANVFISSLEHREVSRALRVANPLYIPMGVATDVYREGTGERENFGLTIAWTSQANAERKCIPELIRAIPLIRQLHPEMRFIVAGERASAYPGLAALAAELGVADCLEFPGAISKEKKIELMQRCKVYISPSRYEGFGLAILEAMSCGAPVVSSPVGAVPEVVGDAGLLVDGNSPEAIASAVNRYLDHEALRIENGQRARMRAETVFPYSRRKRELAEVFKVLLQVS